jgi:hypothetical protein
MNFEQSGLPISPSVSTASSLNLTQCPLSARDTLLSRGISDPELDLLQQQCNLRSVPLMENDQFFKIIQKCLDDKPRGELEAQLRLSVNEEINRVHEAYMNVKHDFATLVYELLQTADEKFQLTKGFRDNTIYGFELLLTCIFPVLRRMQLKDKPRREWTNCKTAKPAQRGVSSSKVSKNGVRQTACISREILPRRSARIAGQRTLK